jgi:hypothetical protein
MLAPRVLLNRNTGIVVLRFLGVDPELVVVESVRAAAAVQAAPAVNAPLVV